MSDEEKALARDVAAVTEIVAKVAKVSPDAIGLDDDLRVRFAIDSLRGLEIIAQLEKKLDIVVPDDHLDAHTTVGEIVAIIQKLRSS